MAIFEWRDEFSVGLESVDYQHRHLVDLINRLDEAVSVGGNEATLRDILKGLFEYTVYHFTTEEELMRAAGPEMRAHYQRHKAEHNAFTAMIRPLAGDAPLEGTDVDDALLDYLVRWLIDHILLSDKEMGRLIVEAGHWADTEGDAPPLPGAGVIGDNHRDVVERRLLDALKESELRFRHLSDSVPVLIWVCDAKGRMVYLNTHWSRVTGHAPEQLRHEGWIDLIHPEDRPGHLTAVDDGLKGRQPFTYEIRLRQEDGHYRWYQESAVPRHSPQGEFLGLIGSATDINARKRAEEILLHARSRLEAEVTRQTAELRDTNERLEREKAEQRNLIQRLQDAQDQLLQSEKMASIGQLAAGVAHEINNPVGYIASNLSTLEEYARNLIQLIDLCAEAEGLLPATERERLDRARMQMDFDFMRQDLIELIRESLQGTDRVKRIVQDLKDFSHVDESEWQLADLHKGLTSTLNVVHNELKYKAEVILELGELPAINCLAAQINQVFMNLLVNAGQAIEEKGTITIRTGVRDDWVWIEVADTGSGIPAENLSRLFEPFFTTKPVGKGTGLGLSVSYSIVAKHGGRIEVESEPGQGSVFRIWLPVEGPPQTDADAPAATPDTRATA